MEVNKKPRRPRIGETQAMNPESGRFEKVTYNPKASSEQASAESGTPEPNLENSRKSYNQNNYNNPRGGYGGNNNYNRGGNYYDRGGNSRYGNRQQGGYGNYNNNYQQGGYGYNRNYENADGYDRQGGYGNRRPNYGNRGGYNQGYNQGGYNNYNRQGGYDNRQPHYDNRQSNNYGNQGGYGNRQPHYDNRQPNNYGNQGGYDNRQPRYDNRQPNNYGNQGGYGNGNRQGGNFNRKGGQRFTPRPKQIVYDLPEMDPNEEIRLNKFMANAGICSRREADELIQKGLVKVNGTPATELGTKIKRDDVIEYNGKVVTLENKCYILLNKPKDCVTTSDDPDGRLTVMDIVKDACKERIYPVGRLDRNTTGVLLLTNDGDLASKLTHPKYVKKKIYHVWTDKDISEEDMQHLADGIDLDDGPIHADAISYVNDHDKNQAGIEIHSGRNRIVRRMFEALGYRVTKLDRVYFAGLTKKRLPRGKWRYLTQEEVNYLKMGAFE